MRGNGGTEELLTFVLDGLARCVSANTGFSYNGEYVRLHKPPARSSTKVSTAGVPEPDLPALGRLTCRLSATLREVLIVVSFVDLLLVRVAWPAGLPSFGNITGVLLIIKPLHVRGSGSRTFSHRRSWCQQESVRQIQALAS